MEATARELGVPPEVLLQGLPERMKHASDGVVIHRFVRLGCHDDYIRIRDARCPDIARPLGKLPARVAAHVMPYMSLKDAAAIRNSLADDHGPSTAHHRQVIIRNPGCLYSKYDAYRTIVAQIDLIDAVSEVVEVQRTPLLRAQLEAAFADLKSLKAGIYEHALRLVLYHLEDGNILMARDYIDLYFPQVGHLIDNNPDLTFESFEYLHASLRPKFAGEQLDITRDCETLLCSPSSYRLIHLKTANLTYLIASLECFVQDLEQKREYLMDRLMLRTLLGAGFAPVPEAAFEG